MGVRKGGAFFGTTRVRNAYYPVYPTVAGYWDYFRALPGRGAVITRRGALAISPPTDRKIGG
jgi:hypothetical protein